SSGACRTSCAGSTPAPGCSWPGRPASSAGWTSRAPGTSCRVTAEGTRSPCATLFEPVRPEHRLVDGVARVVGGLHPQRDELVRGTERRVVDRGLVGLPGAL